VKPVGLSVQRWHCLSRDAALASLEASVDGLSQEEARRRLITFGPNRLPEAKGKTFLAVYVSQFRSPFIYLLLGAGGISLTLGHLTDALFIFGVLVVNAAIGAVQEWQAETRARALKALILGTATVRRDGLTLTVPTDRLVPGDIVQVESGVRIAADLRLLESQRLMVDESLLTGESSAAEKAAIDEVPCEASLGDRSTMLHAGTLVTAGRGLAVVVATARDTQVGQLAAVLDLPPPPPPLVGRMARLTNHIAVAMLGMILLIAAAEAWRGTGITEIFLLAVALAVSAIPEGLPIAMTVCLSIAAQRMARCHVVVRHLAAVEGLGACTLIATDKTGTLTQNRLTVARLWVPGHGAIEPTDCRGRDLLEAAVRASERPAGSEQGPGGDAVDLAIFRAASLQGLNAAGAPPVHRHPYEPEARYAASFHDEGDSLVVYAKGAPETVSSFCREIDLGAAPAVQQLSAEGYRLIAVAAGRTALAPAGKLAGLRLLGLVALIDPLRPETKQAVGRARQAGLQVVLITGDHPLTAWAIARQLGLVKRPEEVLSGATLARSEGSAFDRLVAGAKIFARAEPMQKLAIVQSLRRQGHVVAVTGDGVNDAAALRAADVGVAMGKSGTDIARDAADLILTDDNFASIVAGIEAGRIAHDNLRKVILLTLSTGGAEILLMLLATLFALPPPLTAVQLLWLNLITNGIQDVALAFEAGDPAVLQRAPRPNSGAIFDRRMTEALLLGGAVIGLTAFGYYYWAVRGLGMPPAAAQGAVLWLLVWCENAHCFNCRSEERSTFTVPLSSNFVLVGAVLGTQMLQIIVLWVAPVRDLLGLGALKVTDGLVLAGGGLLVLAVIELYKRIRPSNIALRGRPQPGCAS